MDKKVLLIYNPVAGKNGSRPSCENISSLFPIEYKITIMKTGGKGSGTEIVRTYGNEADIIVVCGGDGTLHEVINGLLSAEIHKPIGYIPIGSTNDLAVALGIPKDINEAAKLITSGHTQHFDIGKINDEYFTYVACFGPGTSVSYSTSQTMKNKLGYSAYMINGFIFNLIPTIKAAKPKSMNLVIDGKEYKNNFYFGAVSNSTSVAGMFKYDKNDIRLNDGKFEVILVRKINNPLDVFRVFHKILKRKYDGDTLLYLKASEVKMKFEKKENWSIDGEELGEVNDVEITVLHNAVEIYSDSELVIKD